MAWGCPKRVVSDAELLAALGRREPTAASDRTSSGAAGEANGSSFPGSPPAFGGAVMAQPSRSYTQRVAYWVDGQPVYWDENL